MVCEMAAGLGLQQTFSDIFLIYQCSQVLMIIKGLFRRYERWNPVHPTYGAFWGMGVGVGCGVGWGPGFGPEVIGYVGAGCGIGFNVGITFAGVGVGLPANFNFEAPYNGKSLLLTEAFHFYLKVSLIKVRLIFVFILGSSGTVFLNQCIQTSCAVRILDSQVFILKLMQIRYNLF